MTAVLYKVAVDITDGRAGEPAPEPNRIRIVYYIAAEDRDEALRMLYARHGVRLQESTFLCRVDGNMVVLP